MAVGRVSEEIKCGQCGDYFTFENDEYEYDPTGFPLSDSFEERTDVECPFCGKVFWVTVTVYIGRD